jgi:glycosyltransferase involved in cell wall biosynthesis
VRVLASAYACEPCKGSEPGVGWNWVCQIAKFHDVWVITRANNRRAIEEKLARQPMPRVRWIFYDLPGWVRFWKKKRRGIHAYYYLWQIGAYWRAQRLHRNVSFDLVHHVTLVTYWMPSFMALLPVPLLWGPVGGGDYIPWSLWRDLSWRGKTYELLRATAQRLSSFDPFLRLTARRAALALGTTKETCVRLRRLGCRNVQLCSQVALSAEEIEQLGSIAIRDSRPFRIASIGTLLHLKGFDIGLRAFAEFCKSSPSAEYWIIGDGAEKPRLIALAAQLGINRSVIFCGEMPRAEVLARLAECDVLLHPALHDSGGYVSLEAMAAGRSVICFDLGGPAMQVTSEVGFKLPTQSPGQAVTSMASALARLAQDAGLRRRLGANARARMRAEFNWDNKGHFLTDLYAQLAAPR